MEKNNTPFTIVETKQLDCHFGPHYYHERKPKSHRIVLQGTRKIGCNAHISIKKCNLFPEFEAVSKEKSTSLRTVKEAKMKRLKKRLVEAPETVQTVTMYFVSLPTEEAHHGHSTGAGVAGYSQRMNSDVAAKLAQIVSEGVTEIKQVCIHVHTRKYTPTHTTMTTLPATNRHGVNFSVHHPYTTMSICMADRIW